VHVQLTPVGVDEPVERLLVTGRRARDQLAGHLRHPRTRASFDRRSSLTVSAALFAAFERVDPAPGENWALTTAQFAVRSVSTGGKEA
jgi:hypothetical protein